MLNLLFLGIMILAAIFLMVNFTVSISKLKALRVSENALSNFRIESTINGNRVKIIGIGIVMISLFILFIGNMRTENFTLASHLSGPYLYLTVYLPHVVMANAVVMVLNHVQIKKLMESTKRKSGDQLDGIIAQLAVKEKIHNGFFILLSTSVSLQFLVFGF